ncbi:MAG: FAD-dependent oxidoreductase [Candidatus Omnitrophica bacterium]|nr:FAD-dependent oxidoreductase [Candidatus Omnitrophota bacterium]
MEKNIKEKDVIIVGAGPAGLSAAIFTQLDGWNTLILESDWVGGQGAIAYTVANYPGFPPGDGKVLMENMEKQVTLPPPAGVGAELKQEKVINIDPDKIIVTTEANRYKGKAIILATGSKTRNLGIPGEDKFVGKGVSYYAVHDLEKFPGKRVLVVGGGNTTAKSALIAKTKASEVILVHRRDAMRAYPAMVKRLQKEGVKIRYNIEVKEIKGEDKVEKVILVNNKTGKEEEITVDWVVICVGMRPNTELAQKIGLKMIGDFVKVDEQMRTSRKGIFACGDIIPGPRHLINAAAEGALAGMAVSEYLALEMVKRGEMFIGAKNGKYADEYLAMLKRG